MSERSKARFNMNRSDVSGRLSGALRGDDEEPRSALGSFGRVSTHMHQAAQFTPASSLRSFAVIVAILGVLYLALDFSVNGLFSSWLFELAVVQPVEARYGFDAEWTPVEGTAHLVIGSVKPKGRFGRAGVQAGYAFSPARCGWFALGGGWYALLGNATGPTSIVLETVPGDVRTEKSFAIR